MEKAGEAEKGEENKGCNKGGTVFPEVFGIGQSWGKG